MGWGLCGNGENGEQSVEDVVCVKKVIELLSSTAALDIRGSTFSRHRMIIPVSGWWIFVGRGGRTRSSTQAASNQSSPRIKGKGFLARTRTLGIAEIGHTAIRVQNVRAGMTVPPPTTDMGGLVHGSKLADPITSSDIKVSFEPLSVNASTVPISGTSA